MLNIIEKDKYYKISLICGKEHKLIDTENRLVAARGGRRRWAKQVTVLKRYKFPVIK